MAATPAKVKKLADQLITCITGLTPEEDPANFGLCREFTLRNFKGYKFGRTNQFDVNSKLSGLEEKFRIYNRDDIADALRSRLNELPVSTFTPELLSLFLTLSDRPLENAHLDDLDALIRPDQGPKGLTWADIIAEDPLEGEIWKDVDFGAESSDEWSDDGEEDVWERREVEGEGRKRKGRWAEEEEEVGRGASVEGFILKGDREGLEALKRAQYWDVGRRVKPVEGEIDVSLGAGGGVENISIISEVQAAREVLFMLLGHPCVLFQSVNGIVSVETPALSTQFALRHTSLLAFKALLNWYGEKGTNLNRIRYFTSIHNIQISPEQQTFTSAVAEKLFLLDQRLVEIEQRFVGNATTNQIASLLSLQSELEPLLHPYILLSNIIDAITNPPTPIPQTTLATLHLEHLFTSACTLQSTGDHPTFTFMTSLFFTSLQTYLRPIRAWMERGELRPAEIFLVSQTLTADQVEPGGLWHDQFTLRMDPATGALQAPRFVHAAAARIFITGKSVVFLQRLVAHHLPSAMHSTDAANAARESGGVELTVPDGGSLAPFQDLFGAAFEAWINDRHHSVSSRLRDILYRDCGLWRSLDALGCVYLCRDGYLFDLLAGGVFEKIDKGVETWGDRFLLTEMVQGVFAGVGCVEGVRLRMRGRMQGGATVREGRKSVKMLKGVEVDYALPWPIMNVINKQAFEVYKAVFTFLLQIRRAQYVLKRLTALKHDFRRLGEPGEGALYYSLKHRLLWFSNTIYYYLTDLVLLPQTAKMRAKMAKALDVDGMISVHSDFINKIKEQCLLGPKLAPIHQTIITLLDLSIAFSDAQTARATRLLSHSSEDLSMRDIPSPRRRTNRSSGSDSDSDDDDDEGEGEDGIDHDTSYQDEGHKRRMVAASVKFNAMLDFVKAGLRGVARAGVMPHLETLAEGLDGVGWEGRYG
ncbi:uncharacterized protein H6S33_002304 [Morchella sextelata]|uniref:uncharacterized protein n=1 Tax=Morchella sextelata TaxID=1174677 RepID=UPI001D04BB16|nr:uncharacterized protein H6S33_002304 [Morchella sextelata]KAH0608252.1 hypothetical protein H6S33_002304 [Morchella sextelata]